jgi:hypothetical protein
MGAMIFFPRNFEVERSEWTGFRAFLARAATFWQALNGRLVRFAGRGHQDSLSPSYRIHGGSAPEGGPKFGVSVWGAANYPPTLSVNGRAI